MNVSMYGGGGTSKIGTVNSNIVTFTDTEALNCQLYSYEIKATNQCAVDGVPTDNPDNAKIFSDLSTTFTDTEKIKCSKGYYNNTVKLEWTNNNSSRIEDFKIYRKIYGSSNDSVSIASENSSTGIYNDETAEPGVYYQYFIQAEADCSGDIIKSNISSDIGFKSPTGIVNGHIDYTGGIAVKGAKVLVTKASGTQGSSLTFDGTDDYLSVPHNANLIPTNNITIEAWIRPAAIKANNYILSKGTGYELYLNNRQPVFRLNNGAMDLTFAVDTFEQDNWRHIAVSYDGINAKIFVNGDLKATQAYVSPIALNTDSLFIGTNSLKTNFFSGNIDEVRIWDNARTEEEILRDYERILNGDETGISASWGFDENIGEYIFDRSKIGLTFNENHGIINNGANWSATIPSSSQLGYIGITDENGDYTISGIRYALAGENFRLTPNHGTHEFDPSNRVIFIGTGSNIHNNQDFEDISAFQVTGQVLFAQTTCASKDVILNIDGEPIIKNGELVMTDTNGEFDIMVPIGEHFISLSKPGHIFSAGRYPPLDYHDFQEPVFGIEFKDTTLRIVTGKVVGGQEQQNNSHVAGFCKNNIGQTTITFQTQNACFTTNVTTIDTSGQFTVEFPPMKYIISDFDITSNPIIQFNDNDLLDLSQNMPFQTKFDTIFVEGTTNIKHNDSIKYHKTLDFIFREIPNLKVTDTIGNDFIGDSIYTWISNNKQDTVKINLITNPFDYPAFSQNQFYNTKIKIFEPYVNKDGGALPINWVHDTVPVTAGKLTITNELAEVESSVIELNQADGDTTYNFRGGKPNVTWDVINPERSYTRIFQILLETGPHSVQWKPLTVSDGEFYRAFILGAKSSDGQSFITKGPQVVSYILRDPPGSQSYSFREVGSSSTSYSSWDVGGGINGRLSIAVKLGTKFSVGLGMQTETKISNNLVLGINETSDITGGGEYESTITVTERWETNSDPVNVGAASDLFIGTAQNVNFGISNNIEIVKKEICDLGLDCHDDEIVVTPDTFKIVRRKGFMMAPEGYTTGFIYDQNHIENYLIPNLRMLRNQYFVKYPTVYISKLPASNSNFGTNNDDPVWGTSATSTDIVGTVDADYDGSSYTFIKATGINDSIRIFNQQIRLWKLALLRNETEKLVSVYNKNRSFNAGPTYSYTHTSQVKNVYTSSYEITLSEEAKIVFGSEIGGTGIESDKGITLHQHTGSSTRDEIIQTSTSGYVLHDSDVGDFFSVNIHDPKNGTGPIFKLFAGQSMCPHEHVDRTKYFIPTGSAYTGGTLQREVPTINVAPAVKINIPADQPADFALTLGNESESGDPMYYNLSILQWTNPHGAIIKVDGINPARQILVPGGASIQKILTIQKGPGDIYEYDSIAVLLTSPCQYSGGTNNDINIGDTCWLSAHFIPTCSDIEIIDPDNQWVVNNSFNDTLNTIIADYDINFAGLEEVKFWYKPSAQSSWIGLQTWYKDTTGMNDPDLKLIPTNDIFTLYPWDLLQMNDGYYDIKASTKCTRADKESDIFSGIVDRINPHPFGYPSPGDGILSPGDEISIQFNEEVDLGLLSKSNFDIRAVLNGTELRHDGFLYFDGVDDYMEIADGLGLPGSFSMEFWVRRNATGAETFISQGVNTDQSVRVGFNTSNRLDFTIASISMNSNTVFDNTWHHVVCSYNNETNVGEIFVDGSLDNTQTILTSYNEGGKLYIGKSSVTASTEKFNGYMHEFRIWNKALDLATIVERMNIQLSGREFNLVGCWQMNEATGTLTKDITRNRNGVINGATWVVEPSGRSQKFDGTGDNIEINSGTYAFTNEMDFTIEFWFKGSVPADTTGLFSNGRADRQGNNPTSWFIFGTPSGQIKVMNDNIVFDAVTTNFFDVEWHHFALVISRIGNTYSYIDGNLQNTTTSNQWLGLGGARFWLGSRGWFEGIVQHNDKYFNGYIDEARIWKLARKQEQIARDRVNRLTGEEPGLVAYYPFEKYTEVMGVLQLSETLENIVDKTSPVTNGDPAFSADVPVVKMERPIQKVPYTFSVNNDKIIFTPTIEPYRIENVTLDITTKDVKDLRGNSMASPKTWIAYVDMNQVVWQDQERNFDKLINEPLSFSANIQNTGGEIKTFKIKNLPEWLTVDQEEGTISPNSYKTLNFDIDPAVNIGNYEHAIYVVTDFGYNESLLIKLRVYSPSPEWNINPNNYEYSMNVIGQLRIDNIISTDTADMLGAFVGDECRGVTKLRYLEAYDMYEVFIDIYSNNESGEEVKFKIWDASQGTVHLNVIPVYSFTANNLIGTPADPVIISTQNSSQQVTQLPIGWKWISFNLLNPDFSDVNETLKNIISETGDLVKTLGLYDDYVTGSGWSGSLTASGGFKNEYMYMIKSQYKNTLEYAGSKLNPPDISIPVNTGWNWIGYTPQVNVSVKDAMGNYAPAVGDILKSQYSFAFYDPAMGWLGSLEYMIPGQGYMLKTSNGPGTLIYPKTGMFKGASKSDKGYQTVKADEWKLNKEKYQNNMSLIAELFIENEEVNENHIIGAFVNDECRGISKPIFVKNEEKYLYFITLYSDNPGETISFKLINDRKEISDIKETVLFGVNQVSGNLNSPVPLTIAEKTNNSEISENSENSEYFISHYPNPFNESIKISYGVPEKTLVRIEIYNVLGKKVKTILKQEVNAGIHTIAWDGSNTNGNIISSGIYLLKINAGIYTQSSNIIKSK